MVIGLTGKACSGKNVVASLLEADYGVPQIDVDKLGWPVLEASHARLVALFGPQAVGRDGKVDHAFLRESIFRDPAKRTALEGIVHPRVVRRVRDMVAHAPGPIVVNAALLTRSHLDAVCDVVVFVDADPSVRLARARLRDHIDAGGFARREAGQRDIDWHLIPPEKRVLITNNEGISELNRQIEIFCGKIGLKRESR